jgi:heat shock protein HslJ
LGYEKEAIMRGQWLLMAWACAILVMVGCAEKKTASSAAASAPASATASDASASTAINLVGTEWRLEDLGGAGIIDSSQATLAFPESGRVAGNGSCNRFMGPVTITGNVLKIGPLAGTRMACAEAISNQEAKYLKALEGATRYEWKDPHLLIYSEGMEKPLQFVKAAAK